MSKVLGEISDDSRLIYFTSSHNTEVNIGGGKNPPQLKIISKF